MLVRLVHVPACGTAPPFGGLHLIGRGGAGFGEALVMGACLFWGVRYVEMYRTVRQSEALVLMGVCLFRGLITMPLLAARVAVATLHEPSRQHRTLYYFVHDSERTYRQVMLYVLRAKA